MVWETQPQREVETQPQREEIMLLGRLAASFYAPSREGIIVLAATAVAERPGVVTLTADQSHLTVSEVAFRRFSESLEQVNGAIRQGRLKFPDGFAPGAWGGLSPETRAEGEQTEPVLWDSFLSHDQTLTFSAGLASAALLSPLLAVWVTTALTASLGCRSGACPEAALALFLGGLTAISTYTLSQDVGSGVRVTVHGSNGRIVVVPR